MMKYSDPIEGDEGNYYWRVTFSKSEGYLNISQFDAKSKKSESVLLSPMQVKKMLKFIRVKGAK